MQSAFVQKRSKDLRWTFHDPQNGEELHFGTQAVIRRNNGTSFREFTLFVHDFALLFDKDGKPLNPPAVPGSADDPGIMGINYRSEPMRERLRRKEDPAYLFSSFVHGDPATPIWKANPGDRVMHFPGLFHCREGSALAISLIWRSRKEPHVQVIIYTVREASPGM